MGFRFRRMLKTAGLPGIALDARRPEIRAAATRGRGPGYSEQRRQGASATLLLILLLALLVFTVF